MKLPKPNIGPWIIRISKHIHIQIFSDVELQSLRTGAPKIRPDYGIFLIIIVCVSYVLFSPFIWNDSYLKLCSTGITNLGLNSDMIFKSYLHPIFIWCKSLRESSLSSNIVSDDYCIYIIIVLVSYVRSLQWFMYEICFTFKTILGPYSDMNFKSYFYLNILWSKRWRKISLSSNVVSDDDSIHIIIVFVSNVR